ncbi:class I SAM-dependent rRNA methyltransferase [Domibacillus enclensis]|uniref:50S rRNA methyltransferase n=1 Tax=Domibacillus enclensis TaxID=1017273 RepID=A0A1N7BDK5_9BACI|nr:class I SAM-dependent rRNA methyltransferase [Domibacillus enclensis]OXS74686.1 50S rRNA methyltransferase [Domibacillus enclensis]SIR49334.1 SAM-dependent methyltransferase [Domibacillus enclensis]
MKTMINIKVNKKAAEKLRGGYPLIERDAVQNPKALKEEGTILRLLDDKKNYIGTGYYGVQNKGVGWIISQEPEEYIDTAFFAKKIEAAAQKRKELMADPDTTAFRFFNGEGDGLGGLIIDYYDGFYVIHWYSEGIYSFQKEILAAMRDTLSFKGIYEKKRFDQKGQYIEDDDFVEGERGDFPMLVKENGVNFAVDLNDGAMTGVFLDQREVRKAIRERYSRNAEMLNMFSYTGAFSVCAALGGALKTTSVDVANRSKPKTIQQFEANGLDPSAHEMIVEDVFHYFKYAARKERTFDLVVVDPPSFAKTKKRTFSAAKDYTKLLKETIDLTKNGGVIVASTNSSAVSVKSFKQFIKTACKEKGVGYDILEHYSLPEDFRTLEAFPEGNYLKVFFVKIMK